MFYSSTIAVALAVLASPLASATVFLAHRTGSDGSGSQIAYTNGTPDICADFTTITGGSNDPCGIDFYVDNGNGPFTFEGCGGSGLSLERNHQFNSNCKFQPTSFGCPGGVTIEQQWNCS